MEVSALARLAVEQSAHDAYMLRHRVPGLAPGADTVDDVTKVQIVYGSGMRTLLVHRPSGRRWRFWNGTCWGNPPDDMLDADDAEARLAEALYQARSVIVHTGTPSAVKNMLSEWTRQPLCSTPRIDPCTWRARMLLRADLATAACADGPRYVEDNLVYCSWAYAEARRLRARSGPPDMDPAADDSPERLRYVAACLDRTLAVCRDPSASGGKMRSAACRVEGPAALMGAAAAYARVRQHPHFLRFAGLRNGRDHPVPSRHVAPAAQGENADVGEVGPRWDCGKVDGESDSKDEDAPNLATVRREWPWLHRRSCGSDGRPPPASCPMPEPVGAVGAWICVFAVWTVAPRGPSAGSDARGVGMQIAAMTRPWAAGEAPWALSRMGIDVDANSLEPLDLTSLIASYQIMAPADDRCEARADLHPSPSSVSLVDDAAVDAVLAECMRHAGGAVCGMDTGPPAREGFAAMHHALLCLAVATPVQPDAPLRGAIHPHACRVRLLAKALLEDRSPFRTSEAFSLAESARALALRLRECGPPLFFWPRRALETHPSSSTASPPPFEPPPPRSDGRVVDDWDGCTHPQVAAALEAYAGALDRVLLDARFYVDEVVPFEYGRLHEMAPAVFLAS